MTVTMTVLKVFRKCDRPQCIRQRYGQYTPKISSIYICRFVIFVRYGGSGGLIGTEAGFVWANL